MGGGSVEVRYVNEIRNPSNALLIIMKERTERRGFFFFFKDEVTDVGVPRSKS